MEGTELVLLMTACSGALISVIVALQKSKCTRIKCCWGGIDCIRDMKNTTENNSSPNINLEQV